MRPQSACLACRERRKRCDRLHRGTSCTFCSARKLECLMAPKPQTRTDSPYELLKNHGNVPHLNSASAAALGQDLIEELARLYFETYQGGFPYLFHQPSFLDNVRDGSIPLILLYGVMGLSARFSTHPSLRATNPWERGMPYAKEAERLLDLHTVSLTTIQACMLLALNFVNQGESNTECVYFAIAARMALLLDLPNAPANTRLEQEINLRVWWSIVTTDTWCSASLCLPRAIKPQENISLPVDEWTFAQMSRDQPSIPNSLVDHTSHSALAHLVELNKLLYEIHRLNAMIVDDHLSDAEAQHSTESLSSSLQGWASCLPPQLQYTDANMARWTTDGICNIYAALHINYNHAGQLLFYQFLHTSEGAEDGYLAAKVCANRCKQHAAILCDLIYNARERHGVDLRYSLLGHILVIASTAQIHSLLFSVDEGEISRAKLRLERNFETITRLHTYWPNVSASFSRLAAFHSACLKGRQTSFRLDRWMLRFMLQFSQPIDEKEEDMIAETEGLKPFDQLRYLLER